MPKTAMRYFREDLNRAESLVRHADPLPGVAPAELLLREDILRSAWMFAVGALDAYFCDAYSDLVAATLLCKVRQRTIKLPQHLDDLQVPVSTVLDARPKRDNWKWRMAARTLMARENILSLSIVQNHFNKFCRDGHKLFDGVVADWITRCPDPKAVFKLKATAFSTTGTPRDQLKKTAKAALNERFNKCIFQRRHDCIHNCDRPRVKPQRLPKAATVLEVIRDVRFLAEQFDLHISTEFGFFLAGLGFSKATMAQVEY